MARIGRSRASSVDVRAYIRTEARMAYGYCERMLWEQDRWVIAPGAPLPAEAPSTWPGTELAFEVAVGSAGPRRADERRLSCFLIRSIRSAFSRRRR